MSENVIVMPDIYPSTWIQGKMLLSCLAFIEVLVNASPIVAQNISKI